MLVQRHRQNAGIRGEDLLHAVTVVRVDVDVGDAVIPLLEQPPDGDSAVVVDAETRRVTGHRVVHAPTDVHRSTYRAGRDRRGGRHGAADENAGGTVHSLEDRVVRATQPEQSLQQMCCAADIVVDRGGAAHRVEVGGGVHGLQQPVVDVHRRRGLDTVEHPERPRQRHRQGQPHRVHRMRRRPSVSEEVVAPDHRGRRGTGSVASIVHAASLVRLMRRGALSAWFTRTRAQAYPTPSPRATATTHSYR